MPRAWFRRSLLMREHSSTGLSYVDAGVDIAAGNRMVDLIKPLVRATARTVRLDISCARSLITTLD